MQALVGMSWMWELWGEERRGARNASKRLHFVNNLQFRLRLPYIGIEFPSYPPSNKNNPLLSSQALSSASAVLLLAAVVVTDSATVDNP